MKKICLLFVSIALVIVGYAQNPNLGTSGAQFLQIPVSARSEAMAGAFTGLSDDASAVFTNPAGIVKVGNMQAHFSYANWFDLFDFSAFAFAYNLGESGTFALSLITFSTERMEITTETQPEGTGRFFDASDVAIGISYARNLTDRFSVGLTAKYISQSIWNESAGGIAFDIGTQYHLDFQNMVIAMSMTNFGQNLRFDGPDLDFTYRKDDNYPISRLIPSRLTTEEYSLPLHFQVGIGFDILQYDFLKLRGALDVSHPNDNSERAHAGVEAAVFDRFFVRGGYKYNYDDQGLTFGVGANIPLGGNLTSFDYSYSAYDILPAVHRISLGISF